MKSMKDLRIIVSNALPDCEVIGIPALESVRRGGALNCISWNINALDPVYLY